MNINPDSLWNVEAEAALLGSMIIGPECISDILPLLDEQAFFKDEHKTIFNSLVTLFVAGVPVDAISLRADLKSLNKLEQIGGVEYIRKLMESVPHAANALYYAKIVEDRRQYRQVIQTVERIKTIPTEALLVDEMVQQIQSEALSIQADKPEREYFTFADDAERISSEVQDHIFIPTGFRDIDGIINGVYPGELVIIAGRPSMGKSAMAGQAALNMAKSGLSIIYFSLEMTFRLLLDRALKQEQLSSLKDLDVTIHERADTPEKQIAFIKSRKKTHKVDAVFIDYLQLMNSGVKNETRVQEISTISRKLKLAAIREDIPIIALSQLNRKVEDRDKHRPRLSDLRESGSIEQDADVVMLINREDYYRKNEDPGAPQDGSTEVIIAKNRRGRTGVTQLVFLDEKVKFGDMQKY